MGATTYTFVEQHRASVHFSLRFVDLLYARNSGPRPWALLALILVTGCAHESDIGIDQYREQARVALEQGDLQTGISALKSVLTRAPNDPEARWMLGRSYLEVGDAVSAEQQILRARGLGFEGPNVNHTLLQARLRQGKYQEVVDETHPLTGVLPESELLLLRGQALLGLGRIRESSQSFQEAHRLNPKAVDPLLGLARIAVLERNFPDARKYLSDLPSDLPEGWQVKGELALLTQDYPSARDAFRALLGIDRENIPGRIGFGQALLGEGNATGARDQAERVLKRAPEHVEAFYLRAAASMLEGDMEGAQNDVLEVLARAPRDPSGLRLQGIIQYLNGNLEQADLNLRLYLQVNPADAEARKLLAATRMRLGQPRQAVELLGPVVHHDPSDPQARILEATARLQQGESEEALRILRAIADYKAGGDTDHAPGAPQVLQAGSREQDAFALAVAAALAQNPDAPKNPDGKKAVEARTKAVDAARDCAPGSDDPEQDVVAKIACDGFSKEMQALLASVSFPVLATADPTQGGPANLGESLVRVPSPADVRRKKGLTPRELARLLAFISPVPTPRSLQPETSRGQRHETAARVLSQRDSSRRIRTEPASQPDSPAPTAVAYAGPQGSGGPPSRQRGDSVRLLSIRDFLNQILDDLSRNPLVIAMLLILSVTGLIAYIRGIIARH